MIINLKKDYKGYKDYNFGKDTKNLFLMLQKMSLKLMSFCVKNEFETKLSSWISK